MGETKNKILLVSLRLFARDGYEAVSMNMISGELGITKAALYKHYKNKQDIFYSIVERMTVLDQERAQAFNVPEGTLAEMEETYHNTALKQIKEYSLAQFKYWTEGEFSSDFRRILTLEQYRNAHMAALFQQYLGYGPLQYMSDLFSAITGKPEKASQLALKFYAPLYMLINLWDSAQNKEEITKQLNEHITGFSLDIQE